MDNNTTIVLEQKFQQMQNEFLEIKKEITLIKHLQEENADLKSQLAAALLEIEQLKIQQKNFTNITSTSVATQQQPTSSSSAMDSKWANVVRSNIPQQNQQQQQQTQQHQKTQKNKQNQKNQKNKKNTNQTSSPPSAKMLDWAYRGFTEATGPTGYQFIHYRNPTRTNQ
ncbi:hypothetical protein, partial, partial [Parasitella parasitica]